MRLHDYAASGNCFKVRLLLRLARIDCELVPTDIFGGDTLGDAYARLNPFRETPVLELDDCAIVQSGAILTYLAEGTPWLPADREQRAQVTAWLLIEQERISPGIAGVRFRLITGRWAPDDPQVAARQATARETLDVMEGRLGASDWLVGDGPTIADLACFGYLSRADEAGVDVAGWPAVAAWLDRVRALDGFEDDFAPYPANAHEQTGQSIYG